MSSPAERSSGLVFENELHDMTATAKQEVIDHEYYAGNYGGEVLFEEVPYFGCRTDLVTVALKGYDLERRRDAVGHTEPLPDERKYRRSYRVLQRADPITREEWIHEDNTYSSEQTSREVWDWLAEHDFLAPAKPSETGKTLQRAFDGSIARENTLENDVPAVAVRVPDCIRVTAWELKQRDWETALRQAKRADCYADRIMVLMDAGGVKPALDNRDRFRDAGVGLASLDEDGIEVHQHPEWRHPPETSTRHLLNERALAEATGEQIQEAIPDE